MKSAVLYVDDESALCRAFERALRGPAVQVTTVTSAPEAVALLGRASFDVIVTDYRMPEINGLELLQAARERAPRARRLLVSGRIDSEEAAEEIARADVDQIVYKPWSLDELRRAVGRAAEMASLQRIASQATVEALVGALALREATAAAYARRAARTSLRLAERLGIDGDERLAVEHGALLGDIAKLGGETGAGEALLERLGVSPLCCAIVRNQDAGRAGRVVAVARAYEGLRDGRGHAEAVAALSGSDYDADVVAALAELA